tara:strand:- start:2264 stop:2776 length:513 start_codon:yes stop_codon:yes gene_type:complete
MFKLWGVGAESGSNIFLKWEKSSDEVVSWVVGNAISLLGSAPAARSSWAKALRAYEKHLAKEAIRAIVLPEVDLLMERSSMARAQLGAGTYTSYPDTRIWVYEVIDEVLKQASVGEAAVLLDVITLNDLAHLEYSGDQGMAQAGMAALSQHLQEWYFRGEGYYVATEGTA